MQVKTLAMTTMLLMMKSFLNSSTTWYHRLLQRAVNTLALVVHWRQLLKMTPGLSANKKIPLFKMRHPILHQLKLPI